MNTSHAIRLQNLRDFTVQICCPENQAIHDTGIAVSLMGEIVTCAEIGVYFPQALGGEKKELRARVALYWPEK